MTIVLDASVVVAALTDSSARGNWALALLTSDDLAAPHIMPAETANILRRQVLAGTIASAEASAAHAELMDMRLGLAAYAPHADRIWELRDNLTTYDAWYVALAEALEAELATLDERLVRAVGPRCGFLTPPAA